MREREVKGMEAPEGVDARMMQYDMDDVTA